MSKKIKKVVLPVGALTLVGAIGALTASQLAFLTDSEGTSNTFTIGDVGLDVIEPNYPGNDSDEVTHIEPNKTIKKDPQIVNTGDNDAVVFAEYEMPLQAGLVIAEDNGTKKEATAVPTAIFDLLHKEDDDTYTTISGYANEGWQLLKIAYKDADGNLIDNNGSTEFSESDTVPATAVTAVYLLGYDTTVAGQDASGSHITNSVFDGVKLKNIVEGQIDNQTKTIEVTGLAIQSDWLGDGTSMNADITNKDGSVKTTGGKITKDTLEKIYDLYFNQNKNDDGELDDAADANSSNALNLKGIAITSKLDVSATGANTATTGWYADGKMAVGDTDTLKIEVTTTKTANDTTEATTPAKYTVESSNPNVVEITSATENDVTTYTVTAKSAGVATITVKTEDGAVVNKKITVGTPSADSQLKAADSTRSATDINGGDKVNTTTGDIETTAAAADSQG
jgi:hypothetical protein